MASIIFYVTIEKSSDIIIMIMIYFETYSTRICTVTKYRYINIRGCHIKFTYDLFPLP